MHLPLPIPDGLKEYKVEKKQPSGGLYEIRRSIKLKRDSISLGSQNELSAHNSSKELVPYPSMTSDRALNRPNYRERIVSNFGIETPRGNDSRPGTGRTDHTPGSRPGSRMFVNQVSMLEKIQQELEKKLNDPKLFPEGYQPPDSQLNSPQASGRGLSRNTLRKIQTENMDASDHHGSIANLIQIKRASRFLPPIGLNNESQGSENNVSSLLFQPSSFALNQIGFKPSKTSNLDSFDQSSDLTILQSNLSKVNKEPPRKRDSVFALKKEDESVKKILDHINYDIPFLKVSSTEPEESKQTNNPSKVFGFKPSEIEELSKNNSQAEPEVQEELYDLFAPNPEEENPEKQSKDDKTQNENNKNFESEIKNESTKPDQETEESDRNDESGTYHSRTKKALMRILTSVESMSDNKNHSETNENKASSKKPGSKTKVTSKLLDSKNYEDKPDLSKKSISNLDPKKENPELKINLQSGDAKTVFDNQTPRRATYKKMSIINPSLNKRSDEKKPTITTGSKILKGSINLIDEKTPKSKVLDSKTKLEKIEEITQSAKGASKQELTQAKAEHEKVIPKSKTSLESTPGNETSTTNDPKVKVQNPVSENKAQEQKPKGKLIRTDSDEIFEKKEYAKKNIRNYGVAMIFIGLVSKIVKEDVQKRKAIVNEKQLQRAIKFATDFVYRNCKKELIALYTEKGNLQVFQRKSENEEEDLTIAREVRDRGSKIYRYLKDILDALISNTNKKRFPPDVIKYISIISGDHGVVPNEYFTPFELARLDYTNFGTYKHLSADQTKMIILYFFLFRILLMKFIVDPWKNVPEIEDSPKLRKNLRSVASVLYYVLIDMFKEKLPKIEKAHLRESMKTTVFPTPDGLFLAFMDDKEKAHIRNTQEMAAGMYTRESMKLFFQIKKVELSNLEILIGRYYEQIYSFIEFYYQLERTQWMEKFSIQN